jgi:hypothetical protein
MLLGQQPAADTTKPAPAPAATLVPVDFSGVLYANFQYRGDAGAAKSSNKFDVERAYLTFRMPAGDHASIRITADVFQQANDANNAFYRGWVIRAKYAYLQYDFVRNPGFGLLARAGLLQNVVIEHVESFWPRWISQTPVERAGFFSSSDAGVASLITLPNKLGELYTSIVNGPGYTSRETDRFKDYSARLTITPLSASANNVLKTLALTAWTYQGAVASKFAAGGAGQIGPIGNALPRTRSGAFVGVRDPRLALGLEFDSRKDGGETGANTTFAPAAEIDSAGRLVAGFAVVKPFQLLNGQSALPLGILARWDRFKPSVTSPGYVSTVIAGMTWDLNKKTALSLDYQEQTPKSGLVGFTPLKTYFMHLVANF